MAAANPLHLHAEASPGEASRDIGVVGAVLALAATYAVRVEEQRATRWRTLNLHTGLRPCLLGPSPTSGCIESGAPSSYAGVTRFTDKTGIRPRPGGLLQRMVRAFQGCLR